MSLEKMVSDHEARIRQLEVNESGIRVEITNLIKKMDDLTTWIRLLVITAIPVSLTAIGYLFVKWIGK